MTITLTIEDDVAVSVSITSLVRLDTGEDVPGVTLPDPMSDAGGGVWQYTFPEPEAGLTYEYEYLVTWDDASTYEGSGTVSEEDDLADGYYVDRQTVIRTAGTDNFRSSFGLSNNQTLADEDIVQEVFDQADRFVDSRAMVLGVTMAADPHYVAEDDPIFGMLSDWASRWARAQGYLLRGTTDNPQATAEGQMAEMKREAEERIDELLTTKINETTEGPGIDGISVITPDCSCAWPGLTVIR